MDMLSKTQYHDTVIEVCSTEFKRLTVMVQTNTTTYPTTRMLIDMGTPGILRINILDRNVDHFDNRPRVLELTLQQLATSRILPRKSSSQNTWTGVDELYIWYNYFFFQNVVVAHRVDSLYIPKFLLELHNFRLHLKWLYAWKEKKIRISNEIRLAAFVQQRKFLLPIVKLSIANRDHQNL